MEMKTSSWNFDGVVPKIFDEHVKQSVPFYSEMHKTISDILGWFIQDNTTIYDVGSSTGTFLKLIKSKYPEKKIHAVGIDKSTAMIEESFSEGVQLICKDVSEYKFLNASAITSILTIQFIQEHKRLDILKNIYDGLNKGGCFVLVEKVLGENPKTQAIWNDVYHDFKIENNFTADDVINKSKSIRGVMNPLTLSQNLELLESAGFSNNDIIFKWCNFVAILCIK